MSIKKCNSLARLVIVVLHTNPAQSAFSDPSNPARGDKYNIPNSARLKGGLA